ncbi:flagellar hook-length control protein FliK [uncultured Desulfovibrio sp.]|uniref:flagellar hook-length control protein FliK n=1 Tax=uncultured Desulfovibrio sp. TaxID=167968 RepID=UPI00260E088A|nr:flagellar hook-length control protein FliK [uncultured Desulfovibrio sp.]
MQILPSDYSIQSQDTGAATAASASGNFAGIFQSSLDSSDSDPVDNFLDSVHSAIDAVNRGESENVKEALEEDEATGPLVDAPYSRHTLNGVLYTLDEVTFTKKELQDLRASLIKAGAPEDALGGLDALMQSPDGAMLAQVMASLQMNSTVKLSDSDKDMLTGLLNQIDPSGELAVNAMDLMQQGKGLQALALIQKTFSGAEHGGTIDISQDDMAILAKGLGLPASVQQKLMSSFGGADGLRCTSDQFSNLMNPARAHLAEMESKQAKLDEAAAQTVRQVIKKARERMEKEAQAESLQSREVQQSKAMIERTVQKQTRENLEAALDASQKENAAREQAARFSEASGRSADGRQSAVINKTDNGLSATGMGKAGEDEHAARANARRGDAADMTGLRMRYSESSEAAATEDGLRRLQLAKQGLEDGDAAKTDAERIGLVQDARHAVTASGDGQKQSGMNDLGGNLHSGQDKTADLAAQFQNMRLDAARFEATRLDAAQQNQQSSLSRQVGQQVQDGFLQAMRSNVRRLDVELHPAELGAITLTLTMRNGEVSAQIRSEKSETAELVSQQLENIRINLEQQGFKVDKLEVGLQNQQKDLAESNGDQWQNMQQHNARQEEDARREELAHLQNLANLRNSRIYPEENDLAQPMHIIGETARYATRSLHVVA